MPWSPSDVARHKKGLSSSQRAKWAKVANAVLKRTGDDSSAIRIANAQTGHREALKRRLTADRNLDQD